ncbi:MAG TPA: dihydroneopterin aldolase family protein [Thermoplasmata archaeon]|nr:dihydroneopterin aldolase family protein [Thermoplasmata archaeon]
MTPPQRRSDPRLSRRETLLFEAGIKLGGVFHQYLGIPVSERTAASLARAIEAAVGLQPFVRRVKVHIHPKRGGPLGRGRFAYRYLTPEMLDVTVQLVDGGTAVEALLQHRPDLRYPLMKVVRMNDPGRPSGGQRRPGRRVKASSRRSRPRSRR